MIGLETALTFLVLVIAFLLLLPVLAIWSFLLLASIAAVYDYLTGNV